MVHISQKLSMQLRQSPQQVLLSSLLQLPVLSLEQRIRMELETNPLLELDMEDEVVQDLENAPEIGVEQPEPVEGEEKADKTAEKEIDWEEILNDQESYEVRIPKEKTVDTYERPEVYQENLTDHLLSQLHMTGLPPDEILIGEYVIWNINGVGYLSMDVETIAENLQVDPDRVDAILNLIQRFDPVGIGARNLQECLLIQLLEEKPVVPTAVAILRDHFEDFKNKRYEKIAKSLEIEIDAIKQTINHITKLNPKPGEGYASFVDNYVIPDLEVRKEDGEFKVYMHDWNIPQLRINNEYRKMMLDRKKPAKKRATISKAGWNRLVGSLTRFISAGLRSCASCKPLSKNSTISSISASNTSGR